jgi:hypothetical protein
MIILIQIKDDDLQLVIVRGHVDLNTAAKSGNSHTPLNGAGPLCRFVNIELMNATSSNQATILLENPRGKYIISPKELLHQVRLYLLIEIVIKFERS